MDQLEATANTDALTARIAVLIQAGRCAAARPLLAAVRRLAPPSPKLAELAAHLDMRDGHPDLALNELDAAVIRNPDHASLRKCRAAVRMQMDDREGAGDTIELRDDGQAHNVEVYCRARVTEPEMILRHQRSPSTKDTI